MIFRGFLFLGVANPSPFMQFKLEFNIDPFHDQLKFGDGVLLLGSCFSDQIGQLLRASKFNVLINPFGTLYNPNAIFQVLEDSLSKSAPEIVEIDEIFYSWNTHSDVRASSEMELESAVQERYQQCNKSIKTAKWIIITPGTSWVYRLLAKNIRVANCHKAPQKEFAKELLSVDEIVSDFDILKAKIKKLNPDIQYIFTVSPVRHIKDGLVENNLSKAILIQAIHRIVKNNDDCQYFPSYEILMDELRDYRFYSTDMTHPNQQAINYVWDRFVEVVMDRPTQILINSWQKIQKSISHRPFNPGSASHQKFLRSTIEKLTGFKDKIDVKREIAALKKELK
jgi:hypothetical protein